MVTKGWLRISIFTLLSLLWGWPLLGEAPIVRGPFGKPILVDDEGGNGTIPIVVYEDAEIETVIPDITSEGWIQWHVEQFRAEGKYFVNLYSFFKGDAICLREKKPAPGRTLSDQKQACHELRYQADTIAVDTRLHTVSFITPTVYFGPALQFEGYGPSPRKYEMSSLLPRTAKAVSRISTLVQNECNSYTGLTAREADTEQRQIVARMAASSLQPNQSTPNSTPIPLPASLSSKGITAPVLLYAPPASYSDQARNEKVQGDVIVSLVVDTNGNPQNIQIAKSIGHGLDEMAIEAAKQYKFKPAQKDGRPVPVNISLSVSFVMY